MPKHPPKTRLHDDATAVEIVHSDVVAHGQVWDVRRDTFVFGGEEISRDYIDHPGAVAILAINDADEILLIQQYRHPISHRAWEIPAGMMDVAGETGLRAAQRELAEETDMQAAQWHVLIDMFLSPGSSSEAMRIFLARELSAAPQTFEREAEEAEIVPRWVPLDDAVAAVLAGDIENAVACGAILAARVAQDAGWSTLRDAATPWTSRDLSRGNRAK